MGRINTLGMLEQGGNSDAVLGWHLQSNHYPPILDGVRFARMAIEAVELGRGDEPIDDPESQRRAPSALAVVESWHLEDFIDEPGDFSSDYDPASAEGQE
jgi:hypothetical protein